MGGFEEVLVHIAQEGGTVELCTSDGYGMHAREWELVASQSLVRVRMCFSLTGSVCKADRLV